MFTNLYMKIFYLRQNFWKYFFFKTKLEVEINYFNGVIALFEKLKAYILTKEQQRIPPRNMVVLYFLTTGFTFWSYLRKTELARSKKTLQPICISIFYMVYIHITEIWFWNNSTVTIEVDMYLLHLMIYFIQNCPAHQQTGWTDECKNTKAHPHLQLQQSN